MVISRYDKTMEVRENTASVSALLRAIPAELKPEWDGQVVRIRHEGREPAFRPLWIGEGLPADARRAVDELVHSASERTDDIIPVVTARRVSPGAREILEDSQLSWADASGRARIVVPGSFYIARLEQIRADAGRIFKWSAAADAIAETLLGWRVEYSERGPMPIEQVGVIAKSADVSVAHTARVLRHFDEQRYTAKTGAERGTSASREFRDPGRMLSDWAAHYAATPRSGADIEFHVPWREPQQSIDALTRSLDGREWALTGDAAADRIAPYLTSVPTVDLYVPAGELEPARARLSQHPEFREVESGGRIRLYVADPYVFRLTREARDVRTVSPVRVYADLLRGRGRSAEAGEYLRETVIGF